MVDIEQKYRLEDPINWEVLTEIDKSYTAELKKMTDEHGWITISKFGKKLQAGHGCLLSMLTLLRVFKGIGWI